MADIELILLVQDMDLLQQVVVASRGLGPDVPAAVEAAEGAAAKSVAQARARHPLGALAVVTSTDADALEAISGGADEALAFEQVSTRDLRLLIDRAVTRAKRRLFNASAHGRAAHAEKLAALGTIVAGVAHEINNPLTTVVLNTDSFRACVEPLFQAFELLEERAAARRVLPPADLDKIVELGRRQATLPELREILGEVSAQLDSVKELVRDLRVYARVDENEAPGVLEVVDLLDRVIRMVMPQIRLRGHVERDYEPNLPPLVLPRSKLVQVLTNILVNAAQAIAEIERPVHRIRVTARTDADFLAISISDSGPGIPSEVLDRIFDPFFTTKAAGKGTGLGLAISQSITRELGGDLLVESVHGEGATFIALFPMASAEALKAAQRSKTAEHGATDPHAKRPTVLVVEDDERLLRVYPRALHDAYDVIVASHGQEAIDLLVSGSSADAVLTDIAMPELDGMKLFQWLEHNRPALAKRTVFVTGGAADDGVREFLRETSAPVLEKPVSRQQLFDAIARAMAGK